MTCSIIFVELVIDSLPFWHPYRPQPGFDPIIGKSDPLFCHHIYQSHFSLTWLKLHTKQIDLNSYRVQQSLLNFRKLPIWAFLFLTSDSEARHYHADRILTSKGSDSDNETESDSLYTGISSLQLFQPSFFSLSELLLSFVYNPFTHQSFIQPLITTLMKALKQSSNDT